MSKRYSGKSNKDRSFMKNPRTIEVWGPLATIWGPIGAQNQ